MTAITRRLAGWKARANGLSAEHELDAVHARYALANVHVQRNGPPMKWIGKGAAARPVPDGPGGCDVTATAKGRAYAAEIKSTAGEAWGFGELQDHQAADLDSQARAGAITGVILRIQGRWFWLSWQALSVRWRAWRSVKRVGPGKGSLDVVDCRLIGRECIAGDWLVVAGACHVDGSP